MVQELQLLLWHPHCLNHSQNRRCMERRGEIGSEDLTLKRKFFISNGLVALFSQNSEVPGKQKDGISNHNNLALSGFAAGL